ncbi:AbrB/MazE/SpoVT family DNA-binding domain-containing protein [Miltoncostaea marina]|uniref:AbrB/MazE/SpoVT family DNA-binding domain-containing protein n=1 Tax=Miltoncostaea marina TaxID=2843215 RepID=UPI001C3C9AF2|nr:AbrB/MazE/SpoVT family DNA-binding domain-containing protein [Miltoncostaea marina]
MTHRIGTRGEVVIPGHLRTAAGLHPGVEIEFELEGDRVTIVRRAATRPLGNRFSGSGMARRLLEDRARERP